MMKNTIKIAILLFEDVELLDFAGPLEVFSLANRRVETEICITTLAEKTGPVKTHNGLQVVPQQTLADCGAIDVLLVPGGIGTRSEMNNHSLIEWIRSVNQTAELMLSVCTGALLFGCASMLDGLEATTHHVAFDLLEEVAPNAIVRRDRRFIDNGRIITSAGIAAGIDMSFHVVKRWFGADIARAVAEEMEYPIDVQ